MISCVVPTLNSAATLDNTLLSLHSQKDVEVKITVADSGSTDGTLDICKRWNVPTLYVEPGNMYRAINAGLCQSKTEWFAYLNSDDWLYPDSFARLIAKGNSLNSDVVYGNCDYVDNTGRFVYSFAAAKPNQLFSLFKMGILGFAQQSAIFRCNTYQKLNGFNEYYSLSSDADFYSRALKLGISFTFIDGPPVACFRLHTNQLSNTKFEAMELEKKEIYQEFIQNAGIYDWLTLAQWRLRNTPHYLIRMLRESLLSGRLKMSKSMKADTAY
ncbi:MAG: glycosyltransferase [Coleofasciculaceae cyanobacterium]